MRSSPEKSKLRSGRYVIHQKTRFGEILVGNLCLRLCRLSAELAQKEQFASRQTRRLSKIMFLKEPKADKFKLHFDRDGAWKSLFEALAD